MTRMKFWLSGLAVLALSTQAFAQTPNNITVNCKFDAFFSKKTRIPQGCHAVANFHFVGEAADHLLVNCPGLGEDTIVYNDEAEAAVNGAIVINPAGELELPAIILPDDAFNCRQTPETFDATLELPLRSPYNGAILDGSCMVVTAGCAAPENR